LFRRHFFLAFAILLIVVMAGAATYKLMTAKKSQGGPGGAPGVAAATGGRQGGPGGPGGPGGAAGRGGGRGGASLVSGVPVSQRPFADRVEVLGVAKGRESVTLTSNNSEMVTAVRFRPGQRVSKGQVLLELKVDEEDAQILQAQSTVAQAKSDADRWKTLADRGVAPRATAEQYQSAYRNAQALLSAAQARRGDRVIRAPFSGIVGLSDVAPGMLISPGTAIATLDDTSVIRVDFDVPDRFLSIIHEGMPITAKTDAYPDQVHSGVIARIDTRVDERTRAVKARAEFRNDGGKLKPGMLMRVGVERGNRLSLAVPESAVQYSSDQSFVYVINARDEGAAPAAAAPAPSRAASTGRPGGGAPLCSSILAAAGAQQGRGAGQPAAAAPQGKAPGAAQPGGPGGGGAGVPGGRRGGGGGGRPATAEQRPILAGLIENGFVEIKEGLRPGEFVVADGLNRLQPGQPVTWCMVSGPQSSAATARGASGAAVGRRGPASATTPGAGQLNGGNRQGRPGGEGGRRAGAPS
jgi:membrane fusion protein, multidrug efflux system